MKLGVCYYPEHWPQERWSTDAELMRKAGLSLVRIADFAWSLMEPREGEYTWKWLDQAIEVLSGQDLQVVLCTPTASPPPWLWRAHPEILPVDSKGRQRRGGSRRHYCINSETYREYTRRIVEAMASRYGSSPAVVGWQIDNEFGSHYTGQCYCDSCAAGFRKWLEAKYKTMEALNQAWGSVFWSQIYNDWDEIDLPNLTVAEPNPSQVLDFHRFSSDSYVSYQQLQIDTLRPYISENQVVTTNFMMQFTELDYYDLAKSLDLVSVSSYPTGHGEQRASLYMPSLALPTFAYDVGDPFLTGFGHTLMRGFKDGRPYWVMEQQCGNVNWGSYNSGIRQGTVRLWTWHALASGADAVLYFRWRAGLYAQEQLHSGLLHHDASPAVGYSDVEGMKSERSLMDEIASEPHIAEIAILLDYDSLWSLRQQPHHRDFGYLRHLFVFYHALQRLGLPVDILSNDTDLSRYKFVIVPTAYLSAEKMALSLKSFAENGGTVLLGVRSGFKTIDNLVTDQPLPGVFHDLVGATVKDWHSLPPGIVYDLYSSIPDLEGSAALWAEALSTASESYTDGDPNVHVLAGYHSGPFTSYAALVEHKIGAGQALYLGWHPNEQQAKALMAYLTSQAGIQPLARIPDGLIASQRGPFTILLNFTDEPLRAVVHDQAVLVGPRAVEVIRR